MPMRSVTTAMTQEKQTVPSWKMNGVTGMPSGTWYAYRDMMKMMSDSNSADHIHVQKTRTFRPRDSRPWSYILGYRSDQSASTSRSYTPRMSTGSEVYSRLNVCVPYSM